MKKTDSFLNVTICLIAICLIFFMSGCAAPMKERDRSDLYWPKGNERPRVRWIKSIYSDLSVRELSAKEKLFGGDLGFSFTKPADVVVDKRGTVYVADQPANGIMSFNLEKGTARLIQSRAIGNPLGIGYSKELDWLGVAMPISKRVAIFELPSMKVKLVIAGTDEVKLNHPVDVAFDAKRDRIYVSDTKASTIRIYDLKGNYVGDLAEPGQDKDHIFIPTSITVDKDGNIYVVETFRFRFHIFDPDGNSIAAVGELGTYVGAFARPKGIAVTDEGQIFVSDAAFNNVQIFDKKGNVYLFFGTAGRVPGRLDIPQGLYYDERTRMLYIADQRNKRIEVYEIYTDKYYAEHPEEAAKYPDATPPSAEKESPAATPEDVSSEFEFEGGEENGTPENADMAPVEEVVPDISDWTSTGEEAAQPEATGEEAAQPEATGEEAAQPVAPEEDVTQPEATGEDAGEEAAPPTSETSGSEEQAVPEGDSE